MGISASIEPTTASIEEILETIENSEIFLEYHSKFWDLLPSRNLFLYEDGVKIELMKEKSYSISMIEFDWTQPDILEMLYEHLDKIYEEFNNQTK